MNSASHENRKERQSLSGGNVYKKQHMIFAKRDARNEIFVQESYPEREREVRITKKGFA